MPFCHSTRRYVFTKTCERCFLAELLKTCSGGAVCDGGKPGADRGKDIFSLGRRGLVLIINKGCVAKEGTENLAAHGLRRQTDGDVNVKPPRSQHRHIDVFEF